MGESVNTKRLAKNTLLLYFRMFLLMIIGLFTSRIVLQTLGIDDFGTYNVVSGFVAMFSILSGSLANAISRFFQVSIGNYYLKRRKVLFSTSVNVQIVMSVLVLILAELIGYWFLNYKINVDPSRINAAFWVLHCSIFSSVIGLISVPYNSLIIAHEKMSAFAYISVLEAFLKLLITYSLFISPFDKLKTYSVLLLLVAIFIRIVYGRYCSKHFDECRYQLSINKPLLKEMLSFVGWNFFGNGMQYINNQGINLLINVYFGVAINAARGIAVQVNNVIQQFITNFVIAAQPQITKAYASGDKESSFRLTCMSSKFAFFLTFFLALPIMVETDIILKLWLINPPDHSVTFVRWTIAASLTTVISNILYYIQMAHGDIKKYQILTSIVNSLLFPLSWIAFYQGMPAVTCFVIAFVISVILIFVRFFVVNKKTGFPFKEYIIDVVIRCFFTTGVVAIIPISIRYMVGESITRLVINCVACIITSILAIYIIGLNTIERKTVLLYLRRNITSKLTRFLHFSQK